MSEMGLELISVACNRCSTAMDWGRDGTVAYGAHTFVALYRPEVSGIWGKGKERKEGV